MTRDVRRQFALALATVGAAVVLFAAGWLTGDAVAALRREPHNKARVTELLAKVQADAAYAVQLQAEYDEQTAATLVRQARGVVLGRTLLAAAVAFLVGAKWLVTLRGGRFAAPRQVMQLHIGASSGLAGLAVTSAGEAPAATCEEIDLAEVDRIVAEMGPKADAAIPILQAVQSHYRYLPNAALRRVCELTEITPAQVAGVASFYTQFRRTPIGRHVVTVCHGTACHVAGAGHISDELRRRLRIAPGEDTDTARDFTVQAVPCLGCCTLAPVVQIDGRTHGHVRADCVSELLREAPRERRKAGRQERATPDGDGLVEVRIGLGSCCVANGSGAVYDAIQAALGNSGAQAIVKRVGCVGMCHQTPFVEIHAADRPEVLYSRVQPEHAEAIVRRHIRPRGLARRLRGTLSGALRAGGQRQALAARRVEPRDPPIAAFLGRQKHIATEHYGDLDPLDLDEYLAHDGFAALERCRRELSPEQIVAQIQESRLRGRGGAGYPTGVKWERVRAAGSTLPQPLPKREGSSEETLPRPLPMREGSEKYVICNGDEGDPGAFMDRMLMESYPYRVIEGLAIAALAVGAGEGIFYIRAEYPLAVERIQEAVRQCEQRGILSTGSQAASGTGRDALHLRVVQGAGAFVCGEETALIASLEGQRGVPTLRPPYPAEEGLWGRPTLVNNVETFAVVPWIIRNGPGAFAALGTATSKGTKVFALTGKIRRGGLIEVPMGITVREIVEDIGGGIKEEDARAGRPYHPRRCHKHSLKAVQIGGPSGGCIPARLADTPVDYEALAGLGAIMGSGGLVVLDETDCMVDMARYFLSFTQNQSCGKCVPCRIGTRRMLEILDRLCDGTGRPEDLATLEELSCSVAQSSLCGLGKTAPNPVLTTLRYFRDEYEAHVAGRCPAGKCKALIRYEVTDDCTGCTLCAQYCPAGAIALQPYERHKIDDEKCTRCDACRTRCPEDAIRVV